MNKQQLLTIYPKGNFQNNPISDDSYLNLPLETEWFCIPLEELSNSEIELLKTLYPDSDDKHFLDHHLWYHGGARGHPRCRACASCPLCGRGQAQ